MNVNIKIVTEGGILEETMNPSVVIPLMNNYFKISGTQNQVKPRVIEITQKELRPVKLREVYLLIAGAALALILLIYILFFTRVKEVDEHQSLLTKIFKRHGERMVALHNKPSGCYDSLYEVMSIDDLVRVSDEIDKPIVYRFREDRNEICQFYVVNGKELYYLDIRQDMKDEEGLDKPGGEQSFESDGLGSTTVAVARWE